MLGTCPGLIRASLVRGLVMPPFNTLQGGKYIARVATALCTSSRWSGAFNAVLSSSGSLACLLQSSGSRLQDLARDSHACTVGFARLASAWPSGCRAPCGTMRAIWDNDRPFGKVVCCLCVRPVLILPNALSLPIALSGLPSSCQRSIMAQHIIQHNCLASARLFPDVFHHNTKFCIRLRGFAGAHISSKPSPSAPLASAPPVILTQEPGYQISI